MEDRNTPQFTIGELLNALEGLKREQGNLDWITYDAMHADRLKARQRQVESAIRTLNRLVKAFNPQ